MLSLPKRRFINDVLAIVAAARPDVVLLPINGHDPGRGVAGNLNADEAVRFAQHAGARMVIPHHFDMFAFNTAPVGDFASACQRAGRPFQILKCGEKYASRSALYEMA